MYTLTINVKDSVVDNILYILKNLSDVKIVDQKKVDEQTKLDQVKGILKGRIKDPVEYQRELRNEWEHRTEWHQEILDERREYYEDGKINVLSFDEFKASLGK